MIKLAHKTIDNKAKHELDKAILFSMQAKKSALWTSVITFVLSLYIPINFEKDIPHFQFVNSYSWLNNENLKFSLFLTSRISQILFIFYLKPILIYLLIDM